MSLTKARPGVARVVDGEVEPGGDGAHPLGGVGLGPGGGALQDGHHLVAVAQLLAQRLGVDVEEVELLQAGGALHLAPLHHPARPAGPQLAGEPGGGEALVDPEAGVAGGDHGGRLGRGGGRRWGRRLRGRGAPPGAGAACRAPARRRRKTAQAPAPPSAPPPPPPRAASAARRRPGAPLETIPAPAPRGRAHAGPRCPGPGLAPPASPPVPEPALPPGCAAPPRPRLVPGWWPRRGPGGRSGGPPRGRAPGGRASRSLASLVSLASQVFGQTGARADGHLL